MMENIRKKINDELANSAYIDKDVDYASLIKYKNNSNLSIVAKFNSLNMVFLNARQEELEFKDFYYGLSPKFDDKKIIDIISKNSASNKEKLNRFVNENGSLFMLYKEQSKYLHSLFKKTIIDSISKFAVKVYVEDERDLEKIKCNKKLDNLIKYTNYNEPVYIVGTISDFLVDELVNLGLYFNEKNDQIVINQENNNNIVLDNQELIKSNIILFSGVAFYSGVMFKLMKINEIVNYYTNDDVDSIELIVHRTTFFTENSFDTINNNLDFLLNSSDQILNKQFFDKEDKLQTKLISKGTDTSIADVNEYLKESGFHNVIGVTSNIETKDNRLILTKRNPKIVDGGLVYPSSNGHVEFYDENVSFYHYSVLEDFPEINAIENQRIDFHGEIERETVAELNVDSFLGKWNYLGLSFIAKTPYKLQNSRRFHFNVLMENKTDKDSKEILKLHTYAVEKFENDLLLFIKINIFKNIIDWISKFLSIIGNFILNNKVLITIFTGIIFIINIITYDYNTKIILIIKEKFTANPVEFSVIVMSSIYFLKNIGVMICNFCKYRKNMKTINEIKLSVYSADINKIVHKTAKKLNCKNLKQFHVLTLLMFQLYIIEKIK